MKVKSYIFSCFALAVCVGVFVISCDPLPQKGTLIMNLTNTETGEDNPGIATLFRQVPGNADYEEVYITFTQISVHKADAAGTDNETSDNSTEDNGGGWIIVSEEEQGFDLMALRDGTFDLLAEAELEAGKYTQIRLKITGNTDDEGIPKTYVMVDGEIKPLTVPSGEQSGLKLIKPFTITEDSETVMYIDFDAERSVVKTGAGTYLLKPTIKVLESMSE